MDSNEFNDSWVFIFTDLKNGDEYTISSAIGSSNINVVIQHMITRFDDGKVIADDWTIHLNKSLRYNKVKNSYMAIREKSDLTAIFLLLPTCDDPVNFGYPKGKEPPFSESDSFDILIGFPAAKEKTNKILDFVFIKKNTSYDDSDNIEYLDEDI